MKNKLQKIPIIYEDKDIIVIDKPAGILSISTDRETKNTAFRIINDYVKTKHRTNRIWIVHRLDRDTSGVMLFAKSEPVKFALQNNWEDVTVERKYIAVVSGRVKPSERKITSWLKQTKTLLVYSSSREGDGKIAITNYKVRQSTAKYSLLDITLETGRKNQIRVHMKDIGHSIVGDKKYGSTVNPLGRLGLHASVLTVKHPTSGVEMRFESAMPECFVRIFTSPNTRN